MSEKRQLNISGFADDYMMFGMMFVLGNKLQTVGDGFYDDITSKQWFAIVVLQIFGDDYPTLMELAEGMGSSHQNVKQIVLKLEAKGYVDMYVDPEDRRKKRIRLTDKQLEISEKYGEAQQQFMAALFQGISKEALKVTVATLVQFEKNLDGIRQDG